MARTVHAPQAVPWSRWSIVRSSSAVHSRTRLSVRASVRAIRRRLRPPPAGRAPPRVTPPEAPVTVA